MPVGDIAPRGRHHSPKARGKIAAVSKERWQDSVFSNCPIANAQGNGTILVSECSVNIRQSNYLPIR